MIIEFDDHVYCLLSEYHIKSGARAYEYEMPLTWLQSAGIIYRCVKVDEGKMPLSAYADNDAFKIYMADTGLLFSKFDIAANGISPYYWESNGKAELDFVFQDRLGNIVPLEAKASVNVRSKSLKRFMELYEPPYAIRVSAKNFGFENGIKSIPLYALFCIER